jgi:hypothetical protein
VGRVGFEPTTPACQGITSIDNEIGRRFESTLPAWITRRTISNSNRTTANDRISYTKKYYMVLINNDPSEILPLSFNKRIHIMKALTAFSKFTGFYNLWQEMISRYNLKWSSGNSLQVFNDIVNENTSFSTMMDWLKGLISKLPESYSNIIIFNVLTGLRPSEACISISLIQQEHLESYYNKGKSLLEHFRYPELFIRRTKKAYVSIVNIWMPIYTTLVKSSQLIWGMKESSKKSLRFYRVVRQRVFLLSITIGQIWQTG